jgi:glutathione synthase/RimK-type ligase-like ATP-grasp enzyme
VNQKTRPEERRSLDVRIAFVTNAEWPNLTEDDQLAAQALQQAGIEVAPARWDDAQVDWSSFASVVLRSTWDYHQRAEEFTSWLDRLETAGVPIWNPLEVVRWNMDKTYLRDLQEDGVRIVPSVWLLQGVTVDLADLMKQKGWDKAVIKPVISASAHQTYTVDAGDLKDGQAKLDDLLSKGGVIVQSFMDEVQSKGEWSLLFFDKKYSHAAIKKPKQDDFRVQWEHGGSAESATASPGLIAQAQAVLEKVEGRLLYARVDGIERDGQFFLMELELIEPFLFFGYDPNAPARFAHALADLIAVRQD